MTISMFATFLLLSFAASISGEGESIARLQFVVR